jgi:hypothetical protein
MAAIITKALKPQAILRKSAEIGSGRVSVEVFAGDGVDNDPDIGTATTFTGLLATDTVIGACEGAGGAAVDVVSHTDDAAVLEGDHGTVATKVFITVLRTA